MSQHKTCISEINLLNFIGTVVHLHFVIFFCCCCADFEFWKHMNKMGALRSIIIIYSLFHRLPIYGVFPHKIDGTS